MPHSIRPDQQWYAHRLNLSSDVAVPLMNAARRYDFEIRALRNASAEPSFSLGAQKVVSVLDDPKFVLANSVRELRLAFKRRSVAMFRSRRGVCSSSLPTLDVLRREISTLRSEPHCSPIRTFPQSKNSGGERLISDFSTIDRARQLILRDIIEARNLSGVADYAARGNGRDLLARQIMQHIHNGHHHWVELDIRNAFPSVKANHVMDLIPIREPHTSIACLYVPSVHTTNPVDTQLPQGGLASQSILSALIGREVRALLSGTGSVWVFVDNIWIGARTRRDAERHLERLTERFRTLAAGPLELSFSEVASLKRGERFTALGYQFRWFSDTREFRCGIANSSFDRFENKLHAKFAGKSIDELAGVFEEYYRTWLSSFSARTINEYSETSYRVSCERRFYAYLQDRMLAEMDEL